jgi:hypothetical protein
MLSTRAFLALAYFLLTKFLELPDFWERIVEFGKINALKIVLSNTEESS